MTTDSLNRAIQAAYNAEYPPKIPVPLSNLKANWGWQAIAWDRVSLVNLPGGGFGVKLTTQAGDANSRIYVGGDSSERADLMLSQADTGAGEGVTQWWAHGITFPDDYVDPPMSDAVIPPGKWNFGAVGLFHNTTIGAGNGNITIQAMPATATSPDRHIGLWIQGFGGAVNSAGAFDAPIGPVVRNSRYQFVWQFLWSSGPTGITRCWVNGAKKLDHLGPNMYVGQGVYLKLQNYHTPFGKPSSVIHDSVLRGTKASDVTTGALEGL